MKMRKSSVALVILLGVFGGCSNGDDPTPSGSKNPIRTGPDAGGGGPTCVDGNSTACTGTGCGQGGEPATTDAGSDSQPGAADCQASDPASVGCDCSDDFTTEVGRAAQTCGMPASPPHSGKPITCGAYEGLYFQGIDTGRVVLYGATSGKLVGMMTVGADAVVHCYSFDPSFTVPLDVFSASAKDCVSSCPSPAGPPGNATCHATGSNVAPSPPTLGGPACTMDFEQCSDGRTYQVLCSYEAGDAGAFRIRCDCLVDGLDSGSFFFASACPVDRTRIDAGCGWHF